jgi:hypothetical protein
MKLQRSTFGLFAVLHVAGILTVAACGGTGSGASSLFGSTASSGAGHAATGGGGSTTSAHGGSTASANGGGLTGSSNSGIGSFASSVGSGSNCTGLACQIHACSTGSTTISGTIYDPAGKNPIYGVVAYVPNTTPSPILSGAQCTSCSDLYTGDPIAAGVTDAKGNFTITNAPDGKDIPLVIQVGKWRRQFVLPAVTPCGNTAVPAGMLTLPKNGTEGDIPNIAISTGSADTLECLLVRVGLDEAEYVPGAAASGHVHIFQGPQGPNTSPAAPLPQNALWDSATDIAKYDIVMLSCEGEETKNMNQQVLYDYAAAGGRVFASHFHYAWFNTGPFGSANLATWDPGSNQIGNINASVVTTDWNNQPFQRGQDMHDWLQNVNALTNDLLPIQAARHNADVTMTNTPSQSWIVQQGQPTQPQDFTFDTPIGADAGAQCGRVAFSDMHVGAASNDYMGQSQTTPAGCTVQDLSPQEKALEFILFDLSSCVTPNNMPQMPPGMPQ